MRERILAAAIELFGEVGYDRASIRALGGRLGITSAALYYHFPNKEEILVALAAKIADGVTGIAASAEAIGDRDERRRRILTDYFDLVWGNRALMSVLESSVAAIRTLPPGARTRRAMDRLAEMLATTDDAGARLRAAAALNILTSAPRLAGRASRAVAREQLIAAAGGALGAATNPDPAGVRTS
ncbi:TetR/AcrR family transcriptional regulator [Fodinicola acaciae]|uniref:TetR/AcrR family transcriptional regulator n=1 Tax=Fodinicola acaciae TaxID=2681555 RepID=UPI001FE31A79|nr:TetR/AcrR family transcriptional regulator [Fodinicola acaciae]